MKFKEYETNSLPKSNDKALRKFKDQKRSNELSCYIGSAVVVTLTAMAITQGWVICAFVAGYILANTLRCLSLARRACKIMQMIETGEASVVGVEED
jgi:hypothetical protein